MITESSTDGFADPDPLRFRFVVTESYVLSASDIQEILSTHNGDDDDWDLSTEELVADAIKCQYYTLPEFLKESECSSEHWTCDLSRLED